VILVELLTFIFVHCREEETKWLSWMEGQLKNIAGGDGDNTEISLEQFKNVLGLKKVNIH
jgi:hypothetical protein